MFWDGWKDAVVTTIHSTIHMILHTISGALIREWSMHVLTRTCTGCPLCIYFTYCTLCRAVVYYGSSPVRHTGTLAKEEKTKIFNYTHRFLLSLKHTGTVVAGTHKPYVIFSFGQPWGGKRVLSKNLVTVVVTYCRALNDFRVKNSVIHDELLFEAQESKDIRIISPTQTDIEAEAFLNPGGGGTSGDHAETSPR